MLSRIPITCRSHEDPRGIISLSLFEISIDIVRQPQVDTFQENNMNISKEDLGTLIVRILGVVSLLLALSHFTTLAQSMAYSQEGATGFSFLGLLRSLTFILPFVLVGFWFLSSAKPIGARLVQAKQTKKSAASRSAREWETLAFSVMGVYLLLTNIPRVINDIALAFSDAPKGLRFQAEIVTTIVILAAGFWLVLRAEGTVALIHRLRKMSAAG